MNRRPETLQRGVLKKVSRSFYLSIRLLPSEMRPAVGIAYLLARLSDTIADTSAVDHKLRLHLLKDFAEMIRSGHFGVSWPSELLDKVCGPGERVLLLRSDEVFTEFQKIEVSQKLLIKEVLEVIISGQIIDLERFCGAGLQVLRNEGELEDYTWRVAGCVGAFWTKLGFSSMGARFSTAEEGELLKLGISYGKGLQLVNILRDLAEDRAQGRSYLPFKNLDDPKEFQEVYETWRRRAVDRVRDGKIYSSKMNGGRLRLASALPADIAVATLDRLKGATLQSLQVKTKVPRRDVYCMLLRGIFGR